MIGTDMVYYVNCFTMRNDAVVPPRPQCVKTTPYAGDILGRWHE